MISDCQGRFEIFLLSAKDGKLHRGSGETLEKGLAQLKTKAGWVQNMRSTLILESPDGVEVARYVRGRAV